ncbi:MAG: ABC transporter permease subunit [Caldilineaceae bacterium]|nr:ABC transporter permease subunit [Caldilineaceae bacterium]MBP8108797.1 ABC transporter permease subunit [Caldilineaceae bacterium]MBP8123953.1 ABC transporter permease subunit [Caldilineaceae bacterium]MBP9073456.1 ABC transporter permease subunit [Caldilineaceae bacterium]
MMLRTIFLKTLHDQARMVLWWAVGFVATSLIYVASYKTYADTGMLDMELPESLGILMGAMDFATPDGYLNTVYFTLIGAALMVIFALVIGARAVAGDEESGMLDLFLAYPISRTGFVLQRFAALLTAVGMVSIVIFAAITLSANISDMGIPVAHIVAACTGLGLLGMVFGAIALCIGALTGRSALAVGVTSGVALATYLANNMAPMFEGMESLQKLSPYYYYLNNNPIRNGFDVGGFSVLVVVILVLLGLSVWGINRRDLSV